MELKKGLISRYSLNSISKSNRLIEFPKSISNKRIMNRAWAWHKNEPGVPGYFNLSFSKALKMAWKSEKDMIKSGGAIYYPYIMMERL